MIAKFSKHWSANDKAELLDLLFVINSLTHGSVSFETSSLMLDCPAYHTHIDTFENPQSALQRTRGFVISLMEYNQENQDTMTHEELEAQGKDSIQWHYMKSDKSSRRLMSQSQLDEENQILEKIKKDYEDNDK